MPPNTVNDTEPALHAHAATLVVEHLYVAQQEARRIRPGDEDALSECYLALVEAAAAWNEALGVPFASWARLRITSRVDRRLAAQRLIVVPRRARTEAAVVIRAAHAHGRAATPADAADTRTSAALRAFVIVPFEDAYEQAVDDTEAGAGGVLAGALDLEPVLQLRFGLDGGGVRTLREVAVLVGMEPWEVVMAEAAALRRHHDLSPGRTGDGGLRQACGG